MARKNRKGVNYPKEFMKTLKKQKHKKIRQTKIDESVIEKGLNNAELEL